MRYCSLEESKFKYDQMGDEMHCFFPVPAGTKYKDIEFKIIPTHLKISVLGEISAVFGLFITITSTLAREGNYR